MIARLLCLLRRPYQPALCERELAWEAWAAEYDRAPGSVRERELWLAYNRLTVDRRQAA